MMHPPAKVWTNSLKIAAVIAANCWHLKMAYYARRIIIWNIILLRTCFAWVWRATCKIMKDMLNEEDLESDWNVGVFDSFRKIVYCSCACTNKFQLI